MSHFSKLFEKVPVEVQNLSGFDLSHENLFTAKCGTLTPCFVYDCIPNTHLSLKVSSQIQLPPMATDFYGKIDAIFESFFVPYRLLYGGWQELITHRPPNSVYPSDTTANNKPKVLPSFKIPSGYYAAGSLADYLGLKYDNDTQPLTVLNPLRFIAYHLIWDTWYRNSFVQAPIFQRPDLTTQGENTSYACYLPYLSYTGDSPTDFSPYLPTGGSIFELRQRNWAKDYFTSSTPLPQAGESASMSSYIIETTGGDKATFSWSQLSAMNSLQRWRQRNNLAGYRYSDQILARFGCLPPDSIMDRPIYLGRTIVPVYTKSVYQQGSSDVIDTNPFNSIGSKYGSSMGVGSGNLIDKFHAREHGVFMTMFSLVPRAYYSTGCNRTFLMNRTSDFPDPDFAHLGDQAIRSFELINKPSTDYTIGYQAKDSHYKYIDDQVHGLLRDGSTLSSFALQRSFDSDVRVELSSSFLQIPQNYLDQVTAVSDASSNYGCWVDAYFDCKASMPLPAASIPTLTDPKDVHSVIINKGGRTL